MAESWTRQAPEPGRTAAPSRGQIWLANSWPPEQRAATQEAYELMGNSPQLAPILEDLARYVGLRQSVLGRAKTTDPAVAMAFAEGQRDVLFHLLELSGVRLTLVGAGAGSGDGAGPSHSGPSQPLSPTKPQGEQ